MNLTRPASIGMPPASSCKEPTLVSVVIPAYNAAPYIATTLGSVLAQTFRSYEIIVVNDGSPDTVALERALEPYLSQIRYVRQENGGPSRARNAGIRLARGGYIAFLDSDDLWLPFHLEHQIATLQSDPDLGLIYANGLHIEGDSQPVAAGISFDSTPQSYPVTFESLLREESTVGTSSTVASREAIVKAGLFDEGFHRCEDYDLWLRMSFNGVKMTFTREIQVCHRLANGLAASAELMKRGRIHVYRKIASSLPLTEKQLSITRNKIALLEAEVQIEVARTALLAGEYDRAAAAAGAAAAVLPSWKLGVARASLRWFPTVTQKLYRAHIRRLEGRKRRIRVESLRKLGIAEGTIDLHALTQAGIGRRRPLADSSPGK